MVEASLLLEARDVAKRFGSVVALKAASLQVRAGEVHAGGWRGAPELMVGVFVAAIALAESANWSALFFVFAVSGLVSIGAMGAASGRGEPVPQRITPGE